MMATEIYHDKDWPHGLRCGDCSVLFTEEMPISGRLIARDGDSTTEILVCVACVSPYAEDSPA